VLIPGYIASSSFLLQVKKVIEHLKSCNPKLIYGLWHCILLANFCIFQILIQIIFTTEPSHSTTT